eukprot:gnl/MRDRNA2_/MRDRNA2_176713_c0_seq1.p1 gnl/MRDRNA2_/MRDRNA2_176713_c0~~gnl/MRDRNA2_/MRDRNA2_176713_c0_seq1.p1  ORF type:complete len:197 (-),score=61.64 gnl/MRDRNA2_/MRDRNA2_176713_c0_seq1:257-847(-)
MSILHLSAPNYILSSTASHEPCVQDERSGGLGNKELLVGAARSVKRQRTQIKQILQADLEFCQKERERERKRKEDNKQEQKRNSAEDKRREEERQHDVKTGWRAEGQLAVTRWLEENETWCEHWHGEDEAYGADPEEEQLEKEKQHEQVRKQAEERQRQRDMEQRRRQEEMRVPEEEWQQEQLRKLMEVRKWEENR